MSPATFVGLPCGLHHDIPERIYHERVLGVMSKGGADLMLKAPAVYKAWADGALVEPSSEELDFGKAYHCALLEPERFAATYVVAPDFGPCRADKAKGVSKEEGAENKARRTQWLADNAGRVPMGAEDAQRIEGMRAAVLSDREVGPLLRAAGGLAEATVKWICPETGVVCRARPDWIRTSFPTDGAVIDVLDIKTTADCSAEAFNRSRVRYGYHRQEAHYREGLTQVGFAVRSWRFVAQEKAPPYLVKCYECGRDVLALGQRQMRQAKRDLARCLELGDWPGMPPGTETLGLLGWEWAALDRWPLPTGASR